VKFVAELDEPMTPIGDRVLIRLLEPPKKVGLIHVPDEAQERMAKEEPRAVVVKVGPGMLTKSGGRWPIEVHEGETVIYDPRVVDAATEVTIQGHRHLVIWSSAILAVEEAA
jgi:co-chaperonin GroES (HSP10)